jgi:hypothetical protein
VWRTTPLAHAAAQAGCVTLGGTLAVFPSYEEQLAAERYFVSQGQWAHLDNFWWGAAWTTVLPDGFDVLPLSLAGWLWHGSGPMLVVPC